MTTNPEPTTEHLHQLLHDARDLLDTAADGHPIRHQAADLAQRITDDIGPPPAAPGHPRRTCRHALTDILLHASDPELHPTQRLHTIRRIARAALT